MDIELKLTPKKVISSRFELCKNENFRQCKYKWPYRSYDGSCNNFENPTWGMAQTRYTRLLPAIYSDGMKINYTKIIEKKELFYSNFFFCHEK